MKYFILFFFYLLLTQSVYPQTKELDSKYIKYIKSTLNNFKSKEERKEYDSYFELLEHRISLNYNKNNYVLDNDYQKLTQNIFQLINSKNTNLKRNTSRFYIIKSNIPNAASLGFNLYFIESGLFNLLDNQFQFAAVICHEIAHNELNHTKLAIEQDAEFEKDFKREIKSIKRQDFLKLIKSQNQVIQKKYDLAEQSRKKEISADSLGYILYKNLNYPKSEYFHLLKKIEEFDQSDKYILDDSIYAYLFDLPEQKFNPKSIKIERNSLFDGLSFTEYINKDSIRTHPNLNDRLNWIHKNFQEDFTKQNVVPSVNFKNIKAKEIENYYENYIHNEEYTTALLELIYEKQKHTNRADLDKYIGEIFMKLFESRKSLKFNKYVAQVDANDKNVNTQKLLSFLWNLTNDELKNIGEYYTKKATD
ncbi:M48 family metalloprotease [Empedobacter brevis]|uniref:M48 family metalloprotease n=2 Tax=Empedobacter brevis TaxID=247 RepID=UPI0028A71259|nr:M48 family metalloprotease [Empedobacter brevis]